MLSLLKFRRQFVGGPHLSTKLTTQVMSKISLLRKKTAERLFMILRLGFVSTHSRIPVGQCT